MINSYEFYNNYHGHTIDNLVKLIYLLKEHNSDKKIVFLAGDSSLDNKYWLTSEPYVKAINNYEYVLQPSLMKPDLNYHLNYFLQDSPYISINCAIEESTLAKRSNTLLPQDIFIHNNIQNDDILIVSVGGNDIALSPSMSTIWNMIKLMYMNSTQTIMQDPDNAWGFTYFIELFRDNVKAYILKLIGKKRPKKIIICMIYYPDEKMTGSWADSMLGYLGYNDNPEKLQTAIQQIFMKATTQIKIHGTKVIPCPMFKILNGKNTKDYVQRVEPSSQGGRKLAYEFVKIMKHPHN